MTIRESLGGVILLGYIDTDSSMTHGSISSYFTFEYLLVHLKLRTNLRAFRSLLMTIGESHRAVAQLKYSGGGLSLRSRGGKH